MYMQQLCKPRQQMDTPPRIRGCLHCLQVRRTGPRFKWLIRQLTYLHRFLCRPTQGPWHIKNSCPVVITTPEPTTWCMFYSSRHTHYWRGFRPFWLQMRTHLRKNGRGIFVFFLSYRPQLSINWSTYYPRFRAIHLKDIDASEISTTR